MGCWSIFSRVSKNKPSEGMPRPPRSGMISTGECEETEEAPAYLFLRLLVSLSGLPQHPGVPKPVETFLPTLVSCSCSRDTAYSELRESQLRNQLPRSDRPVATTSVRNCLGDESCLRAWPAVDGAIPRRPGLGCLRKRAKQEPMSKSRVSRKEHSFMASAFSRHP